MKRFASVQSSGRLLAAEPEHWRKAELIRTIPRCDTKSRVYALLLKQSFRCPETGFSAP